MANRGDELNFRVNKVTIDIEFKLKTILISSL